MASSPHRDHCLIRHKHLHVHFRVHQNQRIHANVDRSSLHRVAIRRRRAWRALQRLASLVPYQVLDELDLYGVP